MFDVFMVGSELSIHQLHHLAFFKWMFFLRLLIWIAKPSFRKYFISNSQSHQKYLRMSFSSIFANTKYQFLQIWYVKRLSHLKICIYVITCCCSVTQSSPTLCDPIDCTTPAFLVHHYLLEFVKTHVHWIGDAIQPSQPLSPPAPPAFHLSQCQGLFQWVRS